MTGIVLGGIGAVVFAIFVGLLAGSVKNRQKNRDQEYQELKHRYDQACQTLKNVERNSRDANIAHHAFQKDSNIRQAELQKKLQLSEMSQASLRQETEALTQELRNRPVSENRLIERVVEKYDNGKKVGETVVQFDTAGNAVKVESKFARTVDQESMLWHEIENLRKTASDSDSARRYTNARDQFKKNYPKSTVAHTPWKPNDKGSNGEKGDWVYWQTKKGTKSKRPSPVLKTRTKDGKQQHLLTYVASKGLSQFWCDASRCERTVKPTAFASLSNDDVLRLCTKKQATGKTPEEKADFRKKLKNINAVPPISGWVTASRSV